jgi:hypothetical protein
MAGENEWTLQLVDRADFTAAIQRSGSGRSGLGMIGAESEKP